MTTQRRLKKSEFLELRLPHPTKQAFMDRCRADGRSASETVRGFIDGYVAGPSKRPPSARATRMATAAAALLACGLAAAPSFARTTASGDFTRLDRDHDGRVSLTEFQRTARVQVALAPGPSGWLRTVGLTSAPAEPPLEDGLRLQVTAAAFRQIDADQDGAISLVEYRRYRSS